MLHIGIGIILGTCSGIGSLHIIGQELQALQGFAVFSMLLTIKHKRLGYLEEAFCHQSLFYLVLNIFHLNIIIDIKTADKF